MMEITAANESAIVRTIGQHEAGTKNYDTLSPLPSLETLSISTESTEATRKESEDEDFCSSEFNDSSSSVSSQDSNNFVAKRSVFSQYWQKTGQTPLLLRLSKSPSSPDRMIGKGSTKVYSTSIATPAAPTSFSSSLYPLGNSIASLSNADLLEDDECDISTQDEDEFEPPMEEVTPSPIGRRRSILPPAPTSHPAMKSWRKSASLSNVEGYSRWDRHHLEHKTRSLPRMRSSPAIQPGPSCLRPHQRYSPSKAEASRPLSQASPRTFLRSDSNSSSVSFQEAVDVRHFEPPRMLFAGKGWSDYFN